MKKKIKIIDYCKFPSIQDDEPEYIGLKIEKNENSKMNFQFVFPVNYYENPKEENEETLKMDITNLLKAIYKANLSEMYNNDSIEDSNCPLDTYLWIIKNYLENGYYIEKETIFSKDGKGKINWKKTIKNNKFLIDDDFNIVYTENIVRKSRNDTNNLITLIHKYCVYEAISTFGYLLNINEKFLERPNLNISEKSMIQILKKEYSHSFLDSKKELLMSMIKMLEWCNNEKTGYNMFSIIENKFHIVFEKLVDEAFGNVYELKQFYPSSIWHICDEEYPASNLREDSIYMNKSELYIIDAKYYKYSYHNNIRLTNKLPQTSSVVKQVVYGEFVEKKLSNNKQNKTIYNIFIIPYNKPPTSNKYIEYVGYVEPTWKEFNEEKYASKTYNRIYTLKVDLKTLVNYKYNSVQENIKLLKNEINQYL